MTHMRKIARVLGVALLAHTLTLYAADLDTVEQGHSHACRVTARRVAPARMGTTLALPASPRNTCSISSSTFATDGASFP